MVAVYNVSSGNYIYVNRAIKKLLGYSPSDFTKKGMEFVASLVHPEDIGRIALENNEALKKANKKRHNKDNEPIINFEYRMRHKNGKYRWLHTDGSVLSRDKKGNVEVVLNISLDITRRKEAEEKYKKLANKLERKIEERTESLEESEKRFRALVERSYDATLLIDRKAKILYATPSVTRIFGRKFNEFMGFSGLKFVHPQDIPLALKTISKLILKPRSTETIQLRVKHKKGHYMWIEATGTNLLREKEINAIVVNLHDITKRKEAENKLIEREALFSTLTNNAPVGIFMTDASGDCLFINKKWSEISGLSPEEAKGKGWIKALHPEDRERVFRKWYEAAKKNIQFQSEYRFMDKKGKVTWLDGSAAALKSGNKITGYLGTIIDITNRIEEENRQDFFIRISELLRLADSTEALGYSIAKETGKFMKASRCFFVEIDQKRDHGRVIRDYHSGLPSVSGPYKLSEYSAVSIPEISSGHTIINNDSKRDPRTKKFYNNGYKKNSERSYIAVPLLRKGVWRGTFWVSDSRPRNWTDGDISVAETVAERYWLSFEKLRAEEEIKESEERLRIAVEAGNIGVWDWNVIEDKITWTDNVYKIHGLEKEDFKGTLTEYSKMIFPQDLDRVRKAIQNAIQNKESYVIEFRIIRPDGGIVWVTTAAKVIFDKNGKPLRMLGATSDITERKIQEQRKDDFIALASHELKTPVTSLKIFTQVLEKKFYKRKDSEMVKYFSTMDKQINKLTELVNGLLDISRSQSGKISYRREKFSINSLVQEVLGNIQRVDNSHTIEVHGASQTQVIGDRDKIGQVLVNLINNAIKFSPNNKKIIVTMYKTNSNVRIGVQDFGIGISKNEQNKIFERFFQAGDSSGRTFPGLGLGLYISKEIIDKHNGKIWVKSEERKGSTFYFTLPVK